MIRSALLFAATALVYSGTLAAAELVLASKDAAPAPIILSKDAGPRIREAAGTLAEYIGKISGGPKPEVIAGAPQPPPERAIWVGLQPGLESRFPGTNLQFQHPEETLIVANAKHVLIAGRDRMVGEEVVENGTGNAVFSFLEDQLGVRWLWPGTLGEDVPRVDRLTVGAPLEKRFHPIFRHRLLWPRQPQAWHRAQRLLDTSLRYRAGHAFTEWWDNYSADHPDYFAQLPNGQRLPEKNPKDVKLCLANPAVAEQWLKNAEVAFKSDPTLITMSASPNDGPGFCVCPKCRAMDHPDGPPTMGYVALTDRYVKFWNTLARGLQQRLPGRDAWVGAYAYSAYRTPPVAEKLEPNIAIGYVGHFPLASTEVRQREKEQWLAWAKQAKAMVFRPNLFHFSGGFLGLPSVSLKSTIEDMRFLAEHQCIGFEVDTLPLNWATQGVQYYLMAQLAYDPLQDGEAVLKDYYERGFGPGARDVASYFAALETAHSAVLERILLSSGRAREAIEVFQEIYTPECWRTAEAHLAAAEKKVATAPEIYRQRLDFLRNGFDGSRLQIDVMRAMKTVRESGGKDKAALARADEVCAARDFAFAKYGGVALRRAKWYIESRRIADYIDAPNEEMRNGTYTGPKKTLKNPPKPTAKDTATE